MNDWLNELAVGAFRLIVSVIAAGLSLALLSVFSHILF